MPVGNLLAVDGQPEVVATDTALPFERLISINALMADLNADD